MGKNWKFLPGGVCIVLVSRRFNPRLIWYDVSVNVTILVFSTNFWYFGILAITDGRRRRAGVRPPGAP